MRISKQASGGSYHSGGRGEYEIAEDAPNGLKPTDLIDHDIYLQLGSQIINTGVQLRLAQGKRRLRRNQKTYPQVQIQVANTLLLPMPQRDEANMTGGQPVLQAGKYIIKHINFGAVNRTSPSSFKAEIRTLDCGNQAFQAEQIRVPERMADVEILWSKRDTFPADIAAILAEHENYVRANMPIPSTASKLVRSLQKAMEGYAADLGVVYAPDTDVVSAMLAVLEQVIDETPAPIDQIEPEQIELRRREIQKWRQYVSRRGKDSLKFKRDVREAYDYRCVMCGSRFPSTSANKNPGIDAAHILPWATYDLDKPCNGLALCKTHHWAFDEHLLTVVYRDGNYYIEMVEGIVEVLYEPAFSINALNQVSSRSEIS